MAEDYWESPKCPKCEAVNHVCHGDMDDFTVPDRDGCICWECGHMWLFDDVEVDDPEEAYYVWGRKHKTE